MGYIFNLLSLLTFFTINARTHGWITIFKNVLILLIKAIVTWDWAGLKVVSMDRSQEVDIAGANF